MMNPFVEDSKVLRRAIDEDVIDVTVELYSNAPVSAMAWLARNESPEEKPPYLNLDQNAQALKTVPHTFGKTPLFETANDNLYELARIAVPDNYIGYLENIEQYVADDAGQYYATQAANIGMPYNETVLYDQIVWHFQIQHYSGALPARFAVAAAAIANYEQLLPGIPWVEMPQIDGLWYAASKRNSFHATIPPGYLLRFFAYVPSTALQVYAWRVAGRLTARIQSMLSKEAHINSRTIF